MNQAEQGPWSGENNVAADLVIVNEQTSKTKGKTMTKTSVNAGKALKAFRPILTVKESVN